MKKRSFSKERWYPIGLFISISCIAQLPSLDALGSGSKNQDWFGHGDMSHLKIELLLYHVSRETSSNSVQFSLYECDFIRLSESDQIYIGIDV
jgi:hypothetical protein